MLTMTKDSMETYASGTRKNLVSKTEEIKCYNIMKQYKMINFDNIAKVNIKEHNLNWPQIRNHQYRILLIGGTRSRKTNALFNIINHKLYTDKIHFYAKDPYEVKYQVLINNRDSARSSAIMILKF